MRKCLVAAMIVLVLGTGAVARQPERAILGEVVGGLVGSFAGMVLGSHVSLMLRHSAEDEAPWVRQLAAPLTFGGIVAGACGGVALAGTLLGVDGNLPLCLLGGCIGLGAGALLSIPVYGLFNIDLDLFLVPAAAVGFALWGFNAGATSR